MKQIRWNLALLFNSDDDPSIEKKRKVLEKKSYEFIDKWKDRKDYVKAMKDIISGSGMHRTRTTLN